MPSPGIPKHLRASSIRPIPGEEELYREEHEQLSKDLGLPAEPPLG